MQKHNVIKSTVITGARLIVTTIAIMFANFSSVEAADLSVSANHDRAVTAPLNKTRHYGNMNGVKIAIPEKYWASVVVQNKTNPSWCQDTSSVNQFKCPIWAISLDLRYPSFEPIYTQQDLIDWHRNFMRPFDKQDLGQHWLALGYRGDLFEDIKGNLGALYRSHLEEATKHFGQLSCNSKYGLLHCVTEKEDGPLRRNEFFFDDKAKTTLIECTRLSLSHGNYLSCTHYFIVPEIKAIAEIGVNSDKEISLWKKLNASVYNITNELIAK